MTVSSLLPRRDHGGNLDSAVRIHGGLLRDWIDLSTGINPLAYPVPRVSAAAWQNLPRQSELNRLYEAARVAYACDALICAWAGAQGAIQAIPYLRAPGVARILAPTYNEHAAALRHARWQVEEVSSPDALAGSDLAIVVNPNNPDGRTYTPDTLADLAKRVGLLVVDESFADAHPELSMGPVLGEVENVIVLRSFGKFYGLAGLRLGFALGSSSQIARLRELSGPWPVSGPAIETAIKAFQDQAWHQATTARLARDAMRLDQMASAAGWMIVGGTTLFRTYRVKNATAAQTRLAQHHIWTRIFPYSDEWIRLGLPGSREDWERVSIALQEAGQSV